MGGIVSFPFPAWDAVEINWKLASSILSWSLTATSGAPTVVVGSTSRPFDLSSLRLKTPSYHKRRIPPFFNVKKLHFLYLAHFSNSEHY